MLVFIVFIISALLWRLGGYRWKWLRRFVLPACLTLLTFAKKRKWVSLITFPILVLAFSLGYGETKPYWQKFIVGFTWIMPALFLNFSWLLLLIPFIWVGLFKLSNTKYWSNIFRWFVVELIVGGLIGLGYWL